MTTNRQETNRVRHKLNGYEYDFLIDPEIRGLCSCPHTPDRTITVIEKLSKQEGLRILIHECLHAEDWSYNEKKIDQVAVDISGLLWKLGFRIRRPKGRKKNI